MKFLNLCCISNLNCNGKRKVLNKRIMGQELTTNNKQTNIIHQIDDQQQIINEADKNQSILNSIDSQFQYLSQFKDPNHIFSNRNVNSILKHLFVLTKNVGNEEIKSDILKLAFKYDIEEFFVPLLNFSTEYVNEYFNEIFQYNFDELEINTHVWKASKLFLLSLVFMDYLLDRPTTVTQKFHQHNLTRVLLKYLSNENFLKNSIYFAEIGYNYRYTINEDFSEMLMIALHNISKCANIFTKDFEELQLVKIVLNYISFVKSMHRYDKLLRAYLVLVNVLNEHDYVNLSETTAIIEGLTKLLHNTAKLISKGKNIYRRRASIDPAKEVKDEVTFITDKSDYEWNSIEIMEDLYHLIVHDSFKWEIFDKYDAKNSLYNIILKGNETEKTFSMKLLWQLCFNDHVLSEFSKCHKIIDYLAQIVSNENIENNRLKLKSLSLMWMTQRKSSKATDFFSSISSINNEIPVELKCDNFIMISYNNETRDSVTKMKEYLESHNYKVWLKEFEHFYLPYLEATINAINNCFCVLICVTEKYKQNNFCRTVTLV